jgi:small subunit ribosomal protein S8e
MKLGKKTSGGRYKKRRKKKKYELPGQAISVKLGEQKKKSSRTKGGNKKTFLLKAQFVNVKGKKLAIKNVLETPSDRFLARQNILTKGTIVETEAGKVKITNRPSQQSMINGVLIE